MYYLFSCLLLLVVDFRVPLLWVCRWFVTAAIIIYGVLFNVSCRHRDVDVCSLKRRCCLIVACFLAVVVVGVAVAVVVAAAFVVV